MSTVTVRFDTAVRQMTEISQQKTTEMSQRKKNSLKHGFTIGCKRLRIAWMHSNKSSKSAQQ